MSKLFSSNFRAERIECFSSENCCFRSDSRVLISSSNCVTLRLLVTFKWEANDKASPLIKHLVVSQSIWGEAVSKLISKDTNNCCNVVLKRHLCVPLHLYLYTPTISSWPGKCKRALEIVLKKFGSRLFGPYTDARHIFVLLNADVSQSASTIVA